MTEPIDFEKIGDQLIDGAGNVYDIAKDAGEALLKGAEALGGALGSLLKTIIDAPWLIILIPIATFGIGLVLGIVFMGKAAPALAAGRVAERIMLPGAR